MREFISLKDALPYYIDSGCCYLSRTGRTWHVIVTSKMDSRSLMPGLTRHYWILCEQNTAEQAIRLAIHRCAERMRVRCQGSVLVHNCRQLLPQEKLSEISQVVRDKYGNDWTYTNERAQEEARCFISEYQNDWSILEPYREVSK